jgi:hypothetical protein
MRAVRMSALEQRVFTLAGGTYPYHVVRAKQRTWDNERSVELPVCWEAVRRHGRPETTIEIGNVLGHYFDTEHRVLDLHERHPLVTWNEDVLEFQPPVAPELIVSISTLEHVGWDERPRNHGAAERAFTHLTELLGPGGTLVVTVPVGYNPPLDEAIRGGRLSLSELRALRREERRNIWHEVDPAEVWDAPYDRLLCTAHGIVVCRADRAPIESAAVAGRRDGTWLDSTGSRVSPGGPGPPRPAEEQHARPRSDRDQGHLGVIPQPVETVAQDRGD